MGKLGRIGGLALALCFVGAAHAQASRTWVSGVGDDVNPCSRTAPCKTFAGAISKTAAGGVINVLDPGGFGAVTITKSLTIDGGGGGIASVLTSSLNGIVVAAGASDVVVLRNLHLEGMGTAGGTGVLLNSGGLLVVERLDIHHFATGIGISATATNSRVDVRGVTVTSSGTGFSNSGAGVIAQLDTVVLRGNGTGLSASGGDTELRRSAIIFNGTGISHNGGTLASFGDNNFLGNTSDGVRTGSREHAF